MCILKVYASAQLHLVAMSSIILPYSGMIFTLRYIYATYIYIKGTSTV